MGTHKSFRVPWRRKKKALRRAPHLGVEFEIEEESSYSAPYNRRVSDVLPADSIDVVRSAPPSEAANPEQALDRPPELPLDQLPKQPSSTEQSASTEQPASPEPQLPPAGERPVETSGERSEAAKEERIERI